MAEKRTAKKSLSLSDIIEAYSQVMLKYGYDQKKENKFYAMMVKLSLS